jgi:hypothetical protein
MSICAKCKNKIPPRVVLDGKERILSSRKYCLLCSPFNKHNTRKLENPPSEKSISRKTRWKTYRLSICPSCNTEKKISIVNKKCSGCTSKERRNENKQKAIKMMGERCQKCGYDKCIHALDFHHIDPSKKAFTVSGKWHYPWSKIETEIKKCLLVCNRCHTEIHHGM